jgi:hypothetical protein
VYRRDPHQKIGRVSAEAHRSGRSNQPHLPPRLGVKLSVVAPGVNRLVVLVALEAALAAGELSHVTAPAQILDEAIERVVGHAQLVQLAEKLLLEPLQLLDLRGTMEVGEW